MSIPYANRSAVAVIPTLAIREQDKVTLDEVLEDFNGQYGPLNSYFYCVQFISSKKLRITFNSSALMEECLSAGLSLRGFPLEPQPISSKKWVSVQRLAIGIPIEAATRILGKYGKVFAAKHETKRGIYTGTLSILMEVQRNIPSALRIRGHTCLIFYRGQIRTCFRCQSPDHTTSDCPYLRSHASTTRDDPPPTRDGDTQDQPSPSAETTTPSDHHHSEATTPASDTAAPPPSAPSTGTDDSQPDAPQQTPSLEEGTAMEGLENEGANSPPSEDRIDPDSGSDRVDPVRTVETDVTTCSPSHDADDSVLSTALTGLATAAAGETKEMGVATPNNTASQSTTTSSSEAADTNALDRTKLLAPPASYASAVDPRATTVITTSDTPLCVTSTSLHSQDFPPIESPPAQDTDRDGFRVPRRQRRPPARNSTRMRSRSRSTSSTDSTSSCGPPTRKRTQPSLVGTGLSSRRSTRDIDISLGQFGALQDLVPATGEVPDIRLTASGNLLPDSALQGNLRPRPTTELDSTLESLLQQPK